MCPLSEPRNAKISSPRSLRANRQADCEHVFEIQIVHRDLLVARAGLPGHAIYHVVRAASELLERCGLGCEGLAPTQRLNSRYRF